MIAFKQKEYAAPLAAIGGRLGLAMMGAGTGISAIQAHNANAEAEEQTEEMQRHNKQMEKIAREQIEESQKNFGMMQAAKSLMGATMKTKAGGLASDLWKMNSPGIKKAAGLGAGFAALGYAGNRVAQSWKDHDEGNDSNTGKALAKIAGTAALVGGGILAAKKGKLGFNEAQRKTVQNFMSKEGTGGKVLGNLGKAINPIVKNKEGVIDKRATLGKVGMNSLFASMPVLGYAAQRNQQKDQVNAQLEQSDQFENQANYSEGEKKSGLGKKLLAGAAVAGTIAGGLYGAKRGIFGAGAQKAVGNAMTSTGSYLRKFESTKGISDKLIKSGSDAFGTGAAKQAASGMSKDVLPGEVNALKNKFTSERAREAVKKPASLLTGTANAISKPLHWLGMMDTKGGVDAMKNAASKMSDPKNSQWTRNIGNWIQKSDRNAALATIGGGVGAISVGGAAMGLGDKAVKSVTKTVDKGAYEMEDEQNQKVYSKISKITFREKGVKTDKETGLRTKFYKKETKINKPGFHAKSIEISEKSFTKWDQTDQIKDMTDSDILAEKERKTSSLSLGKSVVGAGAGALAGGLIGGKLGAGGTGALAGAAIGGMAGMDKQTRDKTAIGSGIGAAAGMGLSLLTKGKISNGAKLGAAIGGTAGVISGVASGHAQNKENEFFNDRLNYAKKKAEKRERADWKNNMTNREGYSK